MEEQLHAEIRFLIDRLGETIDLLAPAGTRDLVERIRSLSKSSRQGDLESQRELDTLIEGLSRQQIEEIIRAFGIYFDLTNLAEDRHRVRVLRAREMASYPAPRGESIGAAIVELSQQGCSAREMQDLLERLVIEPVFTAHPTEAKRRSLREKIRDLRQHLESLDSQTAAPRQREAWDRELRIDMAMLWQTDFLRERRPTVLEELERSLFFFETLWQVVPELYEELEFYLKQQYADFEFKVPTFLRFATWIGGDRDGNPNVTWEVTSRALARLRSFVLAKHIKQCRTLRRSLSLSSLRSPPTMEVEKTLAAALVHWPALAELIKPIAPSDCYRRYLRMIQWRLEQTQSSQIFQEPAEGAYANVREFKADVVILNNSLLAGVGGELIALRIDAWKRQIDVFGFHAMRMDVRQESSWYVGVLDDVLRSLGIADNYAQLDEPSRQEILTRSLGQVRDIELSNLSSQSQETLQLFALLAETVRINGPDALGCHMISMTRSPSDLLAVLWLSRWAAIRYGLADQRLPMAIVPLFETISDLNNSASIVESILSHPAYADEVRNDGQRQTIMIGYSDSTKDGGYLAAAWSQYKAQAAIVRVAERHGVRILFFHGRGGALGRGGGPAARSVLSSPREIINGSMRVTEQGEVLSARYDDPQIARRHLEQVIWSTILVSMRPSAIVCDEWIQWMEELSITALDHYRKLVTMPGFIEYFEQATPIGEIEQLPIGSRPPRRGGQRSLDKLRAIPWVFSQGQRTV